ncbi:hypothetical protein BDY24DRAFT_401995 [Mrakia frigida]|uniref:uncharacterized protein n=1 Tax=Mrakia frigida TaxID=29902 RepID=UPI003FCC09F3
MRAGLEAWALVERQEGGGVVQGVRRDGNGGGREEEGRGAGGSVEVGGGAGGGGGGAGDGGGDGEAGPGGNEKKRKGGRGEESARRTRIKEAERQRSRGTNLFSGARGIHDIPILRLFLTHFCQHPSLPDRLNKLRDAESIYELACRETYNYCVANGLADVWGYLWKEWYSPEKWELWARASSPWISRMRTTMMVEAVWKNLKYNVLPGFKRPRIDHLVYILITITVPAERAKLEISFYTEETWPRRKRPKVKNWVKGLKKEWKSLAKVRINHRYSTDFLNFRCPCGAQMTNAWLLCKHLVQGFEEPEGKCWLWIERRRTFPFYRSNDLFLRNQPSGIHQPFPPLDPEFKSIENGDDHVTNRSTNGGPALGGGGGRRGEGGEEGRRGEGIGFGGEGGVGGGEVGDEGGEEVDREERVEGGRVVETEGLGVGGNKMNHAMLLKDAKNLVAILEEQGRGELDTADKFAANFAALAGASFFKQLHANVAARDSRFWRPTNGKAGQPTAWQQFD